ncbi:amidase [Roseomonas sp. BN140053]|uniref:amidase n=1 Tax=Roseomonas sp. BN140053 TaxID=3391898 RepID=UPI0039ED41CE
MRHEDYVRHDATGLAELVRRREVSAAELLEAMAARVEAVNPAINAVVLERFAEARRAAGELPEGPFTGVPYLIKDLHAPVRGLPLSHGSRFFAGSSFDFDSETVARLRRAGFNIAGRTNSPEFGMAATTEPALHGPARNPWNTAHSTGGSSGGAAAAVASGMLPAAHATDSLGSIRIPAACCGLLGLKPTRGRIPVGPHRGDANQGLSHEHCISRSVRDCATILDATAGPDEGAPWFTASPSEPFARLARRDPGRLRIGLVTTDWHGEPVHPDCASAVEAAGALCTALGHEVAPASLSVEAEALLDCCWTILLPGLAAIIGRREAELGRPAGEEIEPLTRAVAARWGGTSAVEFQAALARLNTLVRGIARQFRAWDVVLTPTLPVPPLRPGELSMQTEDVDGFNAALGRLATFTVLGSTTGQPAMNLPLHRSAEGLPIGVQAIARFAEDAVLLQLATQLEPHFLGLPAMARG